MVYFGEITASRGLQEMNKEAFEAAQIGGHLIPTTYAESHAYLEEVLNRPTTQRQFGDVDREMCIALVVGLPENPEVAVVFKSVGCYSCLSVGEVFKFVCPPLTCSLITRRV